MLSLLLACASTGPEDWTPVEPGPGWDRPAPAQVPLPPSLAELDWLQDVSVWAADGQADGRANAGSFGLGNGLVFGLVGLDRPWNTLTNAIGPGYQRDGGFFGDSAVRLLQDGQPLEFGQAQVQRPRGTAVIRTAEALGDLTLYTTLVAPPDQSLLLRHLAVHNPDRQPGLTLEVGLARSDEEPPPAEGDALLQRRGDRELRLTCEGGQARDGQLEVPLSNQTWTESLCVHAMSDDGSWPASLGMADALEAARQDMGAQLARAAQPVLPDPGVQDLIEGMLVTLFTQTDPSGVVSPMNRYTGGWLRDAEGPVRLYLALGLHERAAAILDATIRAMLRREAISNSFSLTQAGPDAPLPEDPEAFWQTVPFMAGRAASEAPSYPILLQHMLWQHSGQPLPDDGRMAFLQACLDRQEVSPEGLLPFSGDETFRWPMVGTLGAEPETLGWSTQAMLLYVSAARALEALGGSPGQAAQVQAAIEQLAWVEEGGFYSPLLAFDGLEPHPLPYEDVAASPLWWAYPAMPIERQRRNVDSTADALLRESGVLLSPGVASTDSIGFTGMVPGMWLWSLSQLDHPLADPAFDAVAAAATPSGHFDELHGPDLKPLQLVHTADGLGGDVPARYRPWEGGDVVAAVMHHLVGMRADAQSGRLWLSPHLPLGWPDMGFEGLRLGEGRFDLQVQGFEEGLLVSVQRDALGSEWQVQVAGDVRSVAPGERVEWVLPR